MSQYNHIYFIGIGGIGMSAIARYYNTKGYKVSGYDRTCTPLTRSLESEGIEIHYEDNIDYVPKDVENTLVVYTPAVPKDMGELVYVQEHGYRVIKRSRTLGEITRGQRCMAVAGSHGKTTTSTLTSHIFMATGEGCSAFVGGISKNYGTNMLIGENDVIVVEADEFDRSFHQLYPEIAVITSIDADHLDIYGDMEHLREAFKIFASQVSGAVIARYGLPITQADTKAKVYTYGADEPNADFHAEILDDFGHFNLHYPGGVIENCEINVPGLINVENATGAAAIALIYGLEPGKVKDAIASFAGVKRRFDVHYKTEGCVFLDDFAHNPEEIAASLKTIRRAYPGRKLTAVFQPHLFTRTRDFASEFAQVLSTADKVVMTEIYPAREEPIPGVTSDIIFDHVQAPEKTLLKRCELVEWVRNNDNELMVTLGCGDIGLLADEISAALREKNA